MRIAATGTAVALTLISAWALYTESANTRLIEQQLLSSDRLRERLENDIAVLKAERAYLAQPARIEPAARAIGMRPAMERQYVNLDSLLEASEVIEPETAMTPTAMTPTAMTPTAMTPTAIPTPAR